MILYYSGAVVTDSLQPLPELSLGGYKSSSVVPNGLIDNVFSPISKNEVIKNLKQTKLVVLKNTTGGDLTAIKIWIEKFDTSLYNAKIAAVAPTIDNCSNKVFEQIPNCYSLPYGATLDYFPDENDCITIPTLANGDYIGIWIQRVIDLSKFPDIIPPDPPLDGPALVAFLEANPRGDMSNPLGVNLHIKW